ncbi:hypothetical protein Rhe02_04230 [Rhizocola hellebori]|uniref:Uncharacterized protein n=1 Tax=Rhizocola hellebori TaxID=1392758 RepID=A0A8J3Q2C8_9ACTN|nr:hypothetical protein [Rhizocola hellebori]GIH02356.1 hypothetical protein Rhe02_04230 [Rhizocola hellebori]
MMRMPGTTLRLDEVEHKMLQLLCLKTGLSQNQLLVELLRLEFDKHGITREQVQQMVADPDRFWKAMGRQAPMIPAEVHGQVLADLAALDDDPDEQAAAA